MSEMFAELRGLFPITSPSLYIASTGNAKQRQGIACRNIRDQVPVERLISIGLGAGHGPIVYF